MTTRRDFSPTIPTPNFHNCLNPPGAPQLRSMQSQARNALPATASALLPAMRCTRPARPEWPEKSSPGPAASTAVRRPLRNKEVLSYPLSVYGVPRASCEEKSVLLIRKLTIPGKLRHPTRLLPLDQYPRRLVLLIRLIVFARTGSEPLTPSESVRAARNSWWPQEPDRERKDEQ